MDVYVGTKIIAYGKKRIFMTFALLYMASSLNAAVGYESGNKHGSWSESTISAIVGTVEGVRAIHDEKLLASAYKRIITLTKKLTYNEGKEGMQLLKMVLSNRCYGESCQYFQTLLCWVDSQCCFLEAFRAAMVDKFLAQRELFTANVTIPADTVFLEKDGWSKKHIAKEVQRALTEARELKKTSLRQVASIRLIGYLGQWHDDDARASAVLVPFLAKKLLFPRAKSPLGQIESVK